MSRGTTSVHRSGWEFAHTVAGADLPGLTDQRGHPSPRYAELARQVALVTGEWPPGSHGHAGMR